MTIRDLLQKTIEANSSDLHVKPGYEPYIRLDGELVPADHSILEPQELNNELKSLLNPRQLEKLEKDKELDFGFELNGTRFRINMFTQSGNLAAACRKINTTAINLDDLKTPSILKEIVKLKQGFVLVTGPTGSGKSTTLAGMINEINNTQKQHILTIEDPIEYVYKKGQSIISQRELDSDTMNWGNALRSALREDPNIVLIGEMRDYDTMDAALNIAETGHLVLATLHTNSAAESIERIIQSFPTDRQTEIRNVLANVITAIISQRLLPTIGGGRRGVYEILLGNPAVSNLIRDKKEFQIDNVIRTSMNMGMQTIEYSLVQLIREGKITLETAQLYAKNPEDLVRLLR